MKNQKTSEEYRQLSFADWAFELVRVGLAKPEIVHEWYAAMYPSKTGDPNA